LGRYVHFADSYHIYGSYFREFEGRFLGALQKRSFEQRTLRYADVKDMMEEARPMISRRRGHGSASGLSRRELQSEISNLRAALKGAAGTAASSRSPPGNGGSRISIAMDVPGCATPARDVTHANPHPKDGLWVPLTTSPIGVAAGSTRQMV